MAAGNALLREQAFPKPEMGCHRLFMDILGRQDSAGKGRIIYEKNCTYCHGIKETAPK